MKTYSRPATRPSEVPPPKCHPSTKKGGRWHLGGRSKTVKCHPTFPLHINTFHSLGGTLHFKRYTRTYEKTAFSCKNTPIFTYSSVTKNEVPPATLRTKRTRS